jgi:hypothetical protein
LEWVWDFNGRLTFINGAKPENERPLRRRLFALIPEEALPRNEAYAEWEKARAEFERAEVAYRQAVDEWSKPAGKHHAELERAWLAYERAQDRTDLAQAELERAEAEYLLSFDVEQLHAELCHPDCPWDGSTIFGGSEEAT